MGGSSSVPLPEPDALCPKQRAACANDLAGVVKLLKRKGPKAKIAVLCGAGISVSAGIPDFRCGVAGMGDRREALQCGTMQ